MDHSVFQRCLQIFPKFDPKWRPDVQAMWWLCFDMLWAAATRRKRSPYHSMSSRMKDSNSPTTDGEKT